VSPSSSWIRRGVLFLFALLLLGILAFVALRTGPLAPVKVQVTEVARGRVSPEIFGIGQVEARRNWLVGPTVAGRVRSVSVDVGQVVQPGQVLAEMDPVDLDQRLTALDASLARAESARTATLAQVADAQARRALAQAKAFASRLLEEATRAGTHVAVLLFGGQGVQWLQHATPARRSAMPRIGRLGGGGARRWPKACARPRPSCKPFVAATARCRARCGC